MLATTKPFPKKFHLLGDLHGQKLAIMQLWLLASNTREERKNTTLHKQGKSAFVVQSECDVKNAAVSSPTENNQQED